MPVWVQYTVHEPTMGTYSVYTVYALQYVYTYSMYTIICMYIYMYTHTMYIYV